MANKCEQCGASCGWKRFCSRRCGWTWHNRNRTLTPNVKGTCEVCGEKFERYVEPCKQDETTGRFCNRTCAGEWRRRENHPSWKGGRQRDKDGYVLVHTPDHPHANKAGYVREHRLVMEKKIRRYLDPKEVVHHKNGNTSDNRIGNLVLYKSNAEHKAEDINERKRDRRGRLLPLGK